MTKKRDASSYLLKHISQSKRDRLRVALKKRLPKAMEALRDPEMFKRVADAEMSQTPLDRLIVDCERLLRDLGLPIPATGDECRSEITRLSFDSDLREDVKAVGFEQAAQNLALRMVELAADPRLSALEAYHCFKAADEALRTGSDAVQALQNVALGASYLARTCTNVGAAANSNGALKKAATSPAAKTMREIKNEWERLQRPGGKYPGDAAFAKSMHAKHGDVIKNEGSIKNAITRWREG